MTPQTPTPLSLLRTVALGLLLASSSLVQAQELDCQVSVIAPTVNNVEASVFEQLETAIAEFMNGRRWTTD